LALSRGGGKETDSDYTTTINHQSINQQLFYQLPEKRWIETRTHTTRTMHNYIIYVLLGASNVERTRYYLRSGHVA